ncbi:hypothetical protein H8K90_03695 [Winogradskyella echinorum]|uniref:Uncharacterized protein n=1 Tax=Winogradskyella echinorum TaxID=538189 RepID=A0ABR6XYJ4_9FLAO|nr:hypothetical protein [Winogradskyella echinorum]MBC3845474.1 hypothetical protein [Winogradskyella echinorum]MBC5749822.1 hypothetical protein [Winogradskyella echinorum]
MKNLCLSAILVFAISFSFANSNTETKTTNNNFENTLLDPNDCGGCIAYADSRDDGSDRTLKKWSKDLNDCRANSPECQ